MKSLDKFPYDFTYNPTASFAESNVSLDDSNASIVSLNDTYGSLEESTIESNIEGTNVSIEETVEGTTDIGIEKVDDYIWKPFKYPIKNLMIKDCKPDGNCQFRSIEQALYQYNNKYTHIKLRKIIGDYINKLNNDDFQHIIDNYKIEKDNSEFVGNWDPYKVKNKQAFIKHINKLGFHFEGDDTTLNILSDILNVDFIIINKNKSITLKLNNKRAIIILYYQKSRLSGHYQTIGLKSKDTVISAFNSKSLPIEIKELIHLGKTKSPKTKSPKTKSPKTKSPKTKSPKTKSASKRTRKSKSPTSKSTSKKSRKTKSPKTKSPKTKSSRKN